MLRCGSFCFSLCFCVLVGVQLVARRQQQKQRFLFVGCVFSSRAHVCCVLVFAVTPQPTPSPTVNLIKNPTKVPTKNPTANPSRNPTKNPTQNPRCVRIGRPCRGNRNGVTYVKNKIVGCSGAFAGGVFGAQARNLCNVRGGWQICRNAVQVRRLGLTRGICATKSLAPTFVSTLGFVFAFVKKERLHRQTT